VERQLDIQGEWLLGNCGLTDGCRGRVAERELWSDIWNYRASGREGIVERVGCTGRVAERDLLSDSWM